MESQLAWLREQNGLSVGNIYFLGVHCIPLYVRQVGICATQNVIRAIYKSKLCFELFCRIYDLSIVVIVVVRSPYFIHSLGSSVQFCRTDDDFSVHCTLCFLVFIQCTTQTDDNLNGLWDISFRFCAHILFLFFTFASAFCNSVAVQLVHRQRRTSKNVFHCVDFDVEIKIGPEMLVWFLQFKCEAFLWTRHSILFSFNFRHWMPWCAAWNSIR